MNDKIEKIVLNLKECYKESVIIENDKLQDLLLNTLTELKLLEESIMSDSKDIIVKETKSTRYTYEQVKEITKIQLELSKDKITYEVAEREIQKIAPTFPTHNLRQYNKLMKQRTSGIGVYGFRIPANWAKALLEITNNDPLIIQALREEQDLYLEKEGKKNEKLDKLLDQIEG